MPYFTLVPYLIILAGVGLSYVDMLPAMTGWVLSALGVLSGFGLAVTMIFAGQVDLWWAAAIALFLIGVATNLYAATSKNILLSKIDEFSHLLR